MTATNEQIDALITLLESKKTAEPAEPVPVTIPQTSHKAIYSFVASLALGLAARYVEVPEALHGVLSEEFADVIRTLVQAAAGAAAAFYAKNFLK